MASEPAGVEPENNPEVAGLLQDRREGLADRMPPRVRRVELAFGVGFLVSAAIVLAVGGADHFRPVLYVVLLLAYVGAGQVQFEISRGYTDPTLLVVIPAFFLEPPATVPFLVAGGFILARAPEYIRRTAHPEKALAALGNSLHAVGPALVLSLAVDPGGPRASDTGWYLLAFAAYVVGDAAAGILRESIGGGLKPRLQVRLLAQVYALDALLAPVGVLAALATQGNSYAFLLGAPLLVALAFLSRDRAKRFDNALALSESRARVLEAELAAARTRVEILGAVSHGLQTPVAGVVAISGVLARRGASMPGPMVEQSAARLEGDAVALRQVVRQALDYVRLVDGEPLALRIDDVDVAQITAEVAERLRVPPPQPVGPAVARADAVRVHQMVTALLARAVSVAEGDAGAVRVALTADGEAVDLDVWEPGPAPETPEGIEAMLVAPTGVLGTLENQGTGVDLFVTAQAARQLGGSLTGTGDDGALRWRLRLPAATPPTPAAATPPTPPPAPPA